MLAAASGNVAQVNSNPICGDDRVPSTPRRTTGCAVDPLASRGEVRNENVCVAGDLVIHQFEVAIEVAIVTRNPASLADVRDVPHHQGVGWREERANLLVNDLVHAHCQVPGVEALLRKLVTEDRLREFGDTVPTQQLSDPRNVGGVPVTMDVGYGAARHDGGLGDMEGVDVCLGDDTAQDVAAADDVNQHANTIANRSDQQFLFRATANREDAAPGDRDLIVVPDAGKS